MNIAVLPSRPHTTEYQVFDLNPFPKLLGGNLSIRNWRYGEYSPSDSLPQAFPPQIGTSSFLEKNISFIKGMFIPENRYVCI